MLLSRRAILALISISGSQRRTQHRRRAVGALAVADTVPMGDWTSPVQFVTPLLRAGVWRLRVVDSVEREGV